MKKVLSLVFVLLFAPNLLGQSITASQIKKKTSGGLSGDSANALTVTPYRGTSAPASPVTGMLWMDTTTTPPLLKQYNGSTWEATQNNTALPVQDNVDTFPENPVDGHMVWSRSTKTPYIYDNSTSTWRRFTDGTPAQATYTLPTTASVIEPPSVAPSLSFTAGGSATAGAHECVYTFVNSTGGETTPSPASTPASANPNYTYSLTDVLTGGTGTTKRRVYCSKANVPGKWYWVAEIADNTTTTVTATTADASNVQPAPSFNYSGALHSGWTCQNCSTDSGGCGTVSDGAIGCKNNRTGQASAATSDTHPRAAYSLASYGSGVTIQGRIVDLGVTLADKGTSTVAQNLIAANVRRSSSDNAVLISVGNGFEAVLNVTQTLRMTTRYRGTIGAGMTSGTSGAYVFPVVSAYPYWFAFVRETSSGTEKWNTFYSKDKNVWNMSLQSTNFTSLGSFYSFTLTQFEVASVAGASNNGHSEAKVDSILIWANGY